MHACLFNKSSILQIKINPNPYISFAMLFIYSAFLLWSLRSHILLQKCFASFASCWWYVFVHSHSTCWYNLLLLLLLLLLIIIIIIIIILCEFSASVWIGGFSKKSGWHQFFFFFFLFLLTVFHPVVFSGSLELLHRHLHDRQLLQPFGKVQVLVELFAFIFLDIKN